VNYIEVIPFLVGAIQQLRAEILSMRKAYN
jgi:hypothetical protein